MTRTRIFGTARGVPQKVLRNSDLEKMVETSNEWILERTGISERRILEEGRTTSDLAAEAARNACDAAGWDPKSLDCIILGTVTPDVPFPSTAAFVQHKLGCNGSAAFDVSAACAGFLYALSIADAFVRSGQYKRVCVIGVEILSRIVDWKDRNTCVLFGDGAGAVVVGPEEGERGVLSTHLYADGANTEFLLIPAGGSRLPTTAKTVAENQHTVKMNGKMVFAHAVRNIAAACEAALAKNQLSGSDISLVVAHQANLRILQGVAERCKFPMEKFHLNLPKYGNTSSASVPIALDEVVREGKVKEGDRLLFCAMGAGFTWGSALVRW
jgi:3-oxoacyl-[acyl-carrier-protein] synthase-3